MIRRESSARLLKEVHFTAIRGNAAEVRALAGQMSRGSGGDVCTSDAMTEENLEQSLTLVRQLAQDLHSVIAVSGKLDLVSDGTKTAVLRNGCATMARITGSGCMLTTLIGGFCAAAPEHPFEAACAAMAAMGICGEIAEEKRLQDKTGNATFRTALLDAVFNLAAQGL